MINQAEWINRLIILTNGLNGVTISVSISPGDMSLGDVVLNADELKDTLIKAGVNATIEMHQSDSIKDALVLARGDYAFIEVRYIVGGVIMTILDQTNLAIVKHSQSLMTELLSRAKVVNQENGGSEYA